MTGAAALLAGPLADVAGPPVPGAATLIAIVVAGLVTLGVLAVCIVCLRRIAFRTSRRGEREDGATRAVGPDDASSPPEQQDDHR